MFDIEMQEMTPEFFECWKAASVHLNNQVQGGIQSWLRCHPYPPFREHLSFRLGNQLFFIRIVDVSDKVLGPGRTRGLLRVAQEANGHACLLPMKKSLLSRKWCPEEGGWGLIDAKNRKPIDLASLVTDAKIEMTDWETHDLAIQIVRDYIENQGSQLMSWQSDPKVDPAIWFVGKSNKPEWVVVRAVRYPETKAARPRNWDAISVSCLRMSRVGHFASVAIANDDQPFASDGEPAVPLWRGHGLHIMFSGLE